MTATPQIGDMVHIQRICAACEGSGDQHFTFGIDDPELLAILPEFKTSLTIRGGSRDVTSWWDHKPSIGELYKIKMGALAKNVKTIFGRRPTHGYDDTYLIVLGDENVFYMGPSRNIIPLTSSNVSDPRINRIAEPLNFRHFNYLDCTTSVPDRKQGTRKGNSTPIPNPAAPPTDEVIGQKQAAIQELVENAIIERRRELGLSQLMNSSPLGMAAVSACQAMVEVEEPQLDQVHADFRLAAISMGYLGVEMGVAYYRHTWSLDAPNEEIAQHVLEYFDKNAEEELWEDWGFGLTRGTFPEQPTDFGHGLVFGVGYTDGNAVVTNRINEARRRAGLQPLELNHRLRNLAREYLALYSEPSPDQIRRDIEDRGYLRPGVTARWAYSGVYAPIPTGSGDLYVRDVARLVADEFLRTEGELLLRADWQDIGIAVRKDPVLPPDEPSVPAGPAVQAEFLVGWRLPEGAERPSHFPPPTEPASR